MSTFFYYKSSRDNQWYFRLKDNNNETILTSSQGYSTKENCINGISSVKVHSPFDSNYKRFQGIDGKYYFTLYAANFQVIGKSEGYNSIFNRDNGIVNCKKEAPLANIKEYFGQFI